LPNIKSAKKRVEVTKIQRAQNQIAKSILRTTVKKAETAVDEGDREQANIACVEAVRVIDQSVRKGVLHKNTAARKKSGLTLKLNAME